MVEQMEGSSSWSKDQASAFSAYGGPSEYVAYMKLPMSDRLVAMSVNLNGSTTLAEVAADTGLAARDINASLSNLGLTGVVSG